MCAFVVSLLKNELCHIRPYSRCSIKRSDHIKPAYLVDYKGMGVHNLCMNQTKQSIIRVGQVNVKQEPHFIYKLVKTLSIYTRDNMVVVRLSSHHSPLFLPRKHKLRKKKKSKTNPRRKV